MAKTLDQALKKLRRAAKRSGTAALAMYDAMDSHYSAVADALEVLRTAQQITQRDLAARTKIGQAEVSRILSGRTQPRVGTVVRLARALGAELRVVPVASARVSGVKPRKASARRRPRKRI